MALVARDLAYTYSAGARYRVHALAGVSLELGCGDMLVIAGATGSGKSTLLRVLAGLLEPETGVVEIDGASPRSKDSGTKKGVGVPKGDPDPARLLPNATGWYTQTLPFK